MGPYGTQGIGGIKVGKIESGNGGSFTATFNIPAELKGSARIAIRLTSPTSGYFAYNWFFNNTTSGGTGGGTTPGSGYTGFPTFSIVSVVRNSSVTIKGNNFPANDTFNVLMVGWDAPWVASGRHYNPEAAAVHVTLRSRRRPGDHQIASA
jgi:hypothetical protein